MKRRKLLQILGLIPPALLAASCKEKLPSTPTIVTGKIIDENGLPSEGAGLRLTGRNIKGYGGYSTFSITIESDKDGLYRLSQFVPKDTNEMSILPYTTSKVPISVGFGGYLSYIFLKGKYTEIGAPYNIPRSEWGKTITLNYQFIKI